ncbi:hypothetical protein [Streptomyces sp. NPDC048002]|uniref:hypothetical protein n=1 Tax=Streptomyces sp. NPDC048002 TaxID=3154344 RepID=UPI0033D1203B
MTSPTWHHFRRLAAAASLLTMIAAAVGVLILGATARVPEAWWPHTGHAFTADAHPTKKDPCALIGGPGKDYCERGATTTAPPRQEGMAGTVWRLVPAGAGVGAVVVWRLRDAAGQGRR